MIFKTPLVTNQAESIKREEIVGAVYEVDVRLRAYCISRESVSTATNHVFKRHFFVVVEEMVAEGNEQPSVDPNQDGHDKGQKPGPWQALMPA